jgi:hypothetical protein
VKVTVIEQLPFAATLDPGVLLWVKSPGSVPVTDTVPIRTAALSAFVRVMTCGVLDLPTATVPKLRLVGESEI